MKTKILSWNVRELNKRDKRLRIIGLCRDWKADIVCLQVGISCGPITVKNSLLMFLRLLPRILLDHFPLVFDCGVLGRSSQYFKFEVMWLKSEGFKIEFSLMVKTLD